MSSIIVVQYAICYGNPVDGFTFIGPFRHRDDAVLYAERDAINGEWWIVELEQPEELK